MTYTEQGIKIPEGKYSGEIYTLCPKCSHTRKKAKDKCLSVNLDKRVWHCNHCNWSGYLREERQQIVYSKPEWKNKTELPEKVVKYFEGRGIRQETLTKMQITAGSEWMPQAGKEVNTIQFNYFRNAELINIKYRDGAKNFKLHKDAELIFYNIDSIKETDTAIITEGEIDCLAFIEAGIDYVVSVPNGANPAKNNLAYLDNCYEYFEHKKCIIIATDNDNNGRKLRDELAERLGQERCKYLEFGKYKDANDLIQAEGIEGLHACKNAAKDFPLQGVFTISDIEDDIQDMYENGLDKGVSLDIEDFTLNIVKGYITVVTGIPGHGKSDFVDFMALRLKKLAGWNGAFYSPENKPTKLHVSKLVRKLIGKDWEGSSRVTPDELSMSMDYLDRSFWFIKPENDFTIDSILTSVKQLKLKHGIDYFVIDAWNKLEHRYTDSETKHIGETLDKLAIFCEVYNVHCFLVAHPTKMEKEKDSMLYKVPTLYNISGSANFFNKVDNGISVYRNFIEKKTTVFIQKVKFTHWGMVGSCEFDYDVPSGRYYQTFLDRSNWITGKTPTDIEIDRWAKKRIEPITTKAQDEEQDLF
jgi:twinkle protein